MSKINETTGMEGDMQTDNLYRPSAGDLKIFAKVDAIYDQGWGDEFERVVRRDMARVGRSEFNLDARFYALRDEELPSIPRRDIFRRLCNVSPCEPMEMVSAKGIKYVAQLVEINDFERLIRCLLRVLGSAQSVGAMKKPRFEVSFEPG